MAYENLICPNCHCPLSVPPSQTQVACPRCGSFLELEARCNGVCLSCHAAKKAQDTGSCADLGTEQVVSIERSSANTDSAEKDIKNKEPGAGLKALIKRVFHV